MSEKQRLDAELVARGIIQSREQAKAAIMAGQVYVNKPTKRANLSPRKTKSNSEVKTLNT